MAVAPVIDLKSYGSLLSEVHPRVPHTDQENEELIRTVEALEEKPNPSPEELELIELLSVLIDQFEEKHHPIKKPTPDAALRELMKARGLSPKDVYEIFGSKGTTSEVLRGKRAISKNAAKALAQKFNVKLELFL